MSTVNNDPAHYNNATFKAEYHNTTAGAPDFTLGRVVGT